MNLMLLISLAQGILCLAFAACRSLARRIANYGIVDVAWSYAFVLIAALCWCGESGWLARRTLICAMVAAWSLRLGSHVLARVARAHPAEDRRYGQLRRDWSAAFERKMTGFFQLQAFSVVLLSVPFFISCLNPQPGFTPLELAGAALWLLGVAGEALADAQLSAFRRNAANHQRICRRGLWRASRHPNYFFEWVTWVGYAAFACASPWGWLGVISPLAMLYLLLRVTGIPLTEQLSVQSKGEAYREYQRTTSAFVPWFTG